MTAEIVIINQHGVAMAADSAVTIGNQKIINSAIKLFSLSRTEPVGIMIYGNASFMSVPWETLIKLFRKNNTNPLPQLNEYGDSFINFLKSKIHLFDLSQQKDWAASKIHDVYSVIINIIKAEVNNLHLKGQQLDSDTIKNIILSLTLEYSFVLSGNAQLYHGEINDEFELKITEIADELITKMFPVASTEPDIKKQLQQIAKLSITNCAPMNSSGIVIAGFGDVDIFPSVLTYEIYGVFNNSLLYDINNEKTIINNNSNYMKSDVIPFAQEDVVRSFLDGIHPELFEYIADFTNNSLKELFNSPLFSTTAGVNIDKLRSAFIDDLREEILQFTSSKLLSPMIEMIKALPKDELANMAEALVNMTAFRRKMAFSSMETVGGPVDVAVISKGDGFVWVKRKHYFPKELNTRFFENYFK